MARAWKCASAHGMGAQDLMPFWKIYIMIHMCTCAHALAVLSHTCVGDVTQHPTDGP